jgi:hypothetical protein
LPISARRVYAFHHDEEHLQRSIGGCVVFTQTNIGWRVSLAAAGPGWLAAERPGDVGLESHRLALATAVIRVFQELNPPCSSCCAYAVSEPVPKGSARPHWDDLRPANRVMSQEVA